MASPSPLPFSKPPWKGWKSASSRRAGMPTPSSSTVSTRPPPVAGSARPARRSRPPSGIARRPLVARFQTICRICPSSASYQQLGGRDVDLDDVPVVGPRRCCAAASPCRSARGAASSQRHARTAAAARRRGTSGWSSFSRSDSRSTMSISCACSLAERQLLPQDLDRPRHRREGIPDLVGDAGRHLSDGGQALLHAGRRARAACISVTSWNVNRKPARPPGVTRCVGAEPQVDSPRPSGRPVPVARRGGCARRPGRPSSAAATAAGSCRTAATSPADHVGGRHDR